MFEPLSAPPSSPLMKLYLFLKYLMKLYLNTSESFRVWCQVISHDTEANFSRWWGLSEDSSNSSDLFWVWCSGTDPFSLSIYNPISQDKWSPPPKGFAACPSLSLPILCRPHPSPLQLAYLCFYKELGVQLLLPCLTHLLLPSLFVDPACSGFIFFLVGRSILFNSFLVWLLTSMGGYW